MFFLSLSTFERSQKLNTIPLGQQRVSSNQQSQAPFRGILLNQLVDQISITRVINIKGRLFILCQICVTFSLAE